MAKEKSKPESKEPEQKPIEPPVESKAPPAEPVKPADLVEVKPTENPVPAPINGEVNQAIGKTGTVPAAVPVSPADLISAEQPLNPMTVLGQLSNPPLQPPPEAPGLGAAPGEPLKSKRGGWRPGSGRKRKELEPSFDDLKPAEPLPPPIDYALLAKQMFDVSTGTMVMIFGPEWKPNSDAEREAVCGPLQAYLHSKQVQDIPPGIMLSIVILAYSAPRLRGPNTAPKLKILGGKIKLGWLWLKSKFPRRHRPVNIMAMPNPNENKPVTN